MAKQPSKRFSISGHPESIPSEEKAVEIISDPLTELESMSLQQTVYSLPNDILSSSRYVDELTSDHQPPISRTVRTLGLLSVIIGILGTYLTIRSEANGENSLSGRVLYGFTLALAGMLAEAVRSSQSTIAPAMNIPASVPKLSGELKIPLLATQHESVIELSESTSKLNRLKLLRTDTSETDDDLVLPSVRQWTISPRQRLTIWLRWGWDILPTTWFSQAFYLMMRNFIQESMGQTGTAFLLSFLVCPYATLTGLATGYLFHVNLKPWRLGGGRNWIENNRNDLVIVEAGLLALLPSRYNIRSLFYGMTASFWSGYNLNPTISFVLDKIFAFQNKIIATKQSVTPIFRPATISRTFNHLLKSSMGIAAMSASILLLQYVPEDSSDWRNIWAQILACLGGYLLTYPLGITIGHKVPDRYHHWAISLCMYLLIPCAAPGLSIPHYVLLTGGGLCGGIVHDIVSSHYHHDLQAMQERLVAIQAMMVDMPPWASSLLTLPVQEDSLLLQVRKKNRILKGLIDFAGLSVSISSVIFAITSDSSYVILSDAMLAIATAIILMGYRWALPKWSPSVYRLENLSNISRFFYLDSITLSFMWKAATFIFLNTLSAKTGRFFLPSSPSSSSSIFSEAYSLIFIVLFFIKFGYKKLVGGYVPYVPLAEEIERLALLKDSQTYARSQDAKKGEVPVIALNYHLLRFMQENLPHSGVVESKPSVALPVSNPVKMAIVEEDSSLAEEKMAEKTACPHPLFSLGLFAVPHSPQVTPANDSKELPTSPLASVKCRQCQQDVLSVQTSFHAKDRLFTERRFNTGFDAQVADSTIRGLAVAGQFQLNLPDTLKLAKSATRFYF